MSAPSGSTWGRRRRRGLAVAVGLTVGLAVGAGVIGVTSSVAGAQEDECQVSSSGTFSMTTTISEGDQAQIDITGVAEVFSSIGEVDLALMLDGVRGADGALVATGTSTIAAGATALEVSFSAALMTPEEGESVPFQLDGQVVPSTAEPDVDGTIVFSGQTTTIDAGPPTITEQAGTVTVSLQLPCDSPLLDSGPPPTTTPSTTLPAAATTDLADTGISSRLALTGATAALLGWLLISVSRAPLRLEPALLSGDVMLPRRRRRPTRPQL